MNEDLLMRALECSHAGALFNRDRNLLDDFQPEALERGYVHGSIGEQADALDAEIGENLAAETDGAQDAAGAGLRPSRERSS